jgi:hypothetical protein
MVKLLNRLGYIDEIVKELMDDKLMRDSKSHTVGTNVDRPLIM